MAAKFKGCIHVIEKLVKGVSHRTFNEALFIISVQLTSAEHGPRRFT
jgi:hypothetical protein